MHAPQDEHVTGGVAGTLSPLILRTAGIAESLGLRRVVPLRPWSRVDLTLGWGRKPNSDWVAAYAKGRGIPHLRLEDGFLRSIQLGASGEPPLSIAVDDLGIYYDATRASRLESLLGSDDPRLHDAAWMDRSKCAIDLIRKHGLSKYNGQRGVVDVTPLGERHVLVVDQVAGDLSLRFGGVSAQTPRRMLECALSEHANACIWIKAHPDTTRSALGALPRDPRIRLVPAGANPIRLLEQMDDVYVLTSLLGFEALVCGARVHAFGHPFYSHWGLTQDRSGPMARRRRSRSLLELFAATYLAYVRYLEPGTGRPSTLERTLHALIERAQPLFPLTC